MAPLPLSEAELTARALWLVDNCLVDLRTRDVEVFKAVEIRLEALGIRDETVSQRAVDRLRKSKPTLVETVGQLCAELFTLRQGMPALSWELLARRLIRLVDADALVCLDRRFRPPGDERFDWPVVPICQDGGAAAILRDRSVDTHVHMAGCLPPLFYWLALMGGELPLDVLAKVPQTRRGHAGPFVWQQAVGRATWLRLSLARDLRTLASGPGPEPFPLLPPAGDPAWDRFDQAAAETAGSRLRDVTMELTRRHRLFRRRDGDSEGRTSARAFFDPLHREPQGGRRQHYAAGERRFLVRLGSLLRTPPRDQEAAALRRKVERDLLEYLRTRNAFHQLLAHGEGTHGLLRFVETFSRRDMLFAARWLRSRPGGRRARLRRAVLQLERYRMSQALDAQLIRAFEAPFPASSSPPRRRIEMRVSVPSGRYLVPTVRAWLEGICDHCGVERAPRGPCESQVGLVFHFLKKPDRRLPTAIRARDDARRLRHLLVSFPNLRAVVVGIDACGDERGYPPRVFGEAFEKLAECTREPRADPGDPAVRLGRTFHVGEDVDDLLTGLRHVHEAVTLLLPPEGGRLGHALALGEAPKKFYRRRDNVEPPLRTHLLDLVWAHGYLAEAGEGGDVNWLEQRIVQLGCVDGKKIRACFAAMKPKEEDGRREILSEEELLDQLGFDSANDSAQPAVLDPDKRWCKLLRKIQRLLRRDLARRSLSIEANPTSNLVVGGYGSYDQLPYRSLVKAHLPVSINTDDPGLFLTSLAGEFAAMYEGLRRKMSHREAMQWLADRLLDADRSSFLGPHVPLGADLLRRRVDWFFRWRSGW